MGTNQLRNFVFLFSLRILSFIFCRTGPCIVNYKQQSLFLILMQFTGTRVTQVSATDNEDDTISYEIGSDADGKFSIDNTTGWITSNVVIDREVIIHYSTNKCCCCCSCLQWSVYLVSLSQFTGIHLKMKETYIKHNRLKNPN